MEQTAAIGRAFDSLAAITAARSQAFKEGREPVVCNFTTDFNFYSSFDEYCEGGSPFDLFPTVLFQAAQEGKNPYAELALRIEHARKGAL